MKACPSVPPPETLPPSSSLVPVSAHALERDGGFLSPASASRLEDPSFDDGMPMLNAHMKTSTATAIEVSFTSKIFNM